MKLFYRNSVSLILLSITLCAFILTGCAAPVATSDGASVTRPSTTAPSHGDSSQSVAPNSQSVSNQNEEASNAASVVPVELSSQQIEEFTDYVYDWYFFYSDSITQPSEIPQNTNMLRFACQETWRQKLLNGEDLESVGNPDWQIITLTAADVKQMTLDLFGASIDFDSLPKTTLPCAIEELETQLKSLNFSSEVYYIPDKDAFLVSAVYGYDLTALNPVEVRITEDTVTGIISGENLSRTYNFKLDKEKFPFLTLTSIQ